jgi:hypothetical protein
LAVEDFERRLARFHSPVYAELREAQRHVLAAFAASHTSTPDIAVQLPTGVGKTLIALLIADWALDQGRSVAYLTGTNQLADQVLLQAADLPGLTVHKFSGGKYPGASLDDYHQAQAIGLMNFWVYFNSRPRVQPADVLILDDAHLAEQPITDLFALRIPKRRAPELFERLCDLLLAHSDSYLSLRAIRDGSAPLTTPPELIAFNDWAAVAPAAEATIEASGFATTSDGRFVWPELRARLTRCGVLVGPAAIEIRPYHPPTQLYPGYRQARQRLYLSATLGTMDDLQRRLGVGPIEAIDVPGNIHAGSTGRRIFLLNPSPEPAFSDRVLEFALMQAAQSGRVAWLCASHAEADSVEDVVREAGKDGYRLQPGDDTNLVRWRNSADGHLIAAGRFDGLDFAGDVCRLVILPSVPAASSEFERFVVAYLGDAAFMRHRVGQRVTQALGRANRLEDDWAIYLGLDPGFAGMLAQPAVRNAIPSEASATIRRALELHDQGWAATEAAATTFRQGDQAETAEPPRRPGRAVAGAHAVGSAPHEVDAATSFWLADFPRAGRAAGEASALLRTVSEAEHAAFWNYIQAHAYFSEGTPDDIERARTALREAITTGPRTAWFVRLRHTLDELEGRDTQFDSAADDMFLVWDEWLREGTATALATVSRGREQLSGTHDQQVEGLMALGRLAGATADRPSGPSAADARWVWITPQRAERRLWEIKTGTAQDAVSRDDVNQVLGQLTVEAGRHHRSRVFGCLLTPLDQVTEDAAAAARDRIAIVNHGAATFLYDRLADRFRTYAGLWGSGSAAERGRARESVEDRLGRRGWLARLLAPSQGRVRMRTNVEAEFGLV